jgi:NAD(P)-dependent dehydrogenase (short-subunit alcohol dehydrogenase family)
MANVIVINLFRRAERKGEHSATPAKGVAPFIAGASATKAAVEGLARCLATEWGPLGIRVVCVRSAGIPESPRIQEVFEGMARIAGVPKDALFQAAKEKTLLKRMPTLGETAAITAFLASDGASSLTGAIINASRGEVLD